MDRFYCYWEWKVDPVKASASASAPLFHYDECPGENERAWAPERAVQSQTPVTRPWCGMPPGEFPQVDYKKKSYVAQYFAGKLLSVGGCWQVCVKESVYKS